MGCSGNCSGCSGCGRALALSEPEIAILEELGQIPFLPVARKASDMTPVYLEDDRYDGELYSLALQCLEKKMLIRIDYDQPLAGASMEKYKAYPVHGSFALTERGQQVLDLMEKQGIDKE